VSDINAPVVVEWTAAETKTLNIMASVLGMSTSCYIRGKVFRFSDEGKRLDTGVRKLIERFAPIPETAEDTGVPQECDGSGDCPWCRDTCGPELPCPFAECT
jgi:hypothetical protein